MVTTLPSSFISYSTPLRPTTNKLNTIRPAFGSDESKKTNLEDDPEDIVDIKSSKTKKTDKSEEVFEDEEMISNETNTDDDEDNKINEEKTSNKKNNGPKENVIGRERQFSFKNAVRQFTHGFAKPIEQLVQLIKEPAGLATAAVGGISISYVAKKIPKFPKYALVATSTIGAWNIGKGLANFAKAKNVEEREKSFNDMGKGAFYGTTALLPATKIAKSQGIIAQNAKTNPFKSLGNVWKSSYKDAVAIVKSVINNDPGKIQSILGMTTTTGIVTTGDAAINDNSTDIPSSNNPNDKKDKPTWTSVARDTLGDENPVTDSIKTVEEVANKPTNVLATKLTTEEDNETNLN